MLKSQVPNLSACVYVCMWIQTGGIQYRIKLGQPDLILPTELMWPKKAWSASQHRKRKEETRASRIATEMATKRKEIRALVTALSKVNQSRQGTGQSLWRGRERENLFLGKCDYRRDGKSDIESSMSFIQWTDGQSGTQLNESLLLTECCFFHS